MSPFLPLSRKPCSHAELKSIKCLNDHWRFRWFLLFESLATCIRSQKNSESRVCCAYSEMSGGVLDQGVIFRGALFCHPGDPVWLASVGMFLAMIRGFTYHCISKAMLLWECSPKKEVHAVIDEKKHLSQQRPVVPLDVKICLKIILAKFDQHFVCTAWWMAWSGADDADF